MVLKNKNCKRKSRVQKLANCTLAAKLDVQGRHCMLSYLSSLHILRSLDTEANEFYDRTKDYQMLLYWQGLILNMLFT